MEQLKAFIAAHDPYLASSEPDVILIGLQEISDILTTDQNIISRLNSTAFPLIFKLLRDFIKKAQFVMFVLCLTHFSVVFPYLEHSKIP